jgi:hypothetical protein
MKRVLRTGLCLLLVLGMHQTLSAQDPDTLFVDDGDGEPAFVASGSGWQIANIGFRGAHHFRLNPLQTGTPDLGATWRPEIPVTDYYVLHFFLPATANSPNSILYTVNPFGTTPDSMHFDQNIDSGNWRMMGVYLFTQGTDNFVKMIWDGTATTGYVLRADAIRLVRAPEAQDLEPNQRYEHNFGEANIGGQKDWVLPLWNIGGQPLTVTGISSQTGLYRATDPATFPIVIQPRSSVPVTISFFPNFETTFNDTLSIFSDDPLEPEVRVPVTGLGTKTTVIVNNDDGPPDYMEHVGTWQNSNGTFVFPDGRPNPTSRYSILSQNPGARAQFTPTIPASGLYNIFYGGPVTANASNHALFEIAPFGSAIDSVWIDQNTGIPGDWKYLGTYFLFEGRDNSVFVVNDGTGSGYVVRADVIRFTTVSSVADIAIDVATHNFVDVPVGTFRDWSLQIRNLGDTDLNVTGMTTRTPQFEVIEPTTFPQVVGRLDSLTATVRFTPDGILSFRDTLSVFSDDLDEPELQIILTGNGIGVRVQVDDSDSSLVTVWPDTAWHLSGSINGINGTSLFAWKYGDNNANAYVQWTVMAPKTMEYEVYASSVPSENATEHAPYVVDVIGGQPDTVIVDQTSTSASNVWIYVGTYQFIEGIPTNIRVVNDTTYTYQDTNAVIRADAVRISQPVSVTLSAFYASYENRQIVINWAVSRETDNIGFNIYRTTSDDVAPLPKDRLNERLIQGRSPYRFTDPTALFGQTYYYWLEDVDRNGNRTMHGPISANLADGIPRSFELSQNFPNPFNPETTIKFDLPRASEVTVRIYNVLGQQVRALVQGRKEAGTYSVVWDARNDLGRMVSSGMYVVEMRASVAGKVEFVQRRKMLLMR